MSVSTRPWRGVFLLVDGMDADGGPRRHGPLGNNAPLGRDQEGRELGRQASSKMPPKLPQVPPSTTGRCDRSPD